MECFKTKYIQNHLLKFKPEKIGGLGNFPESKIKLIKNTLNIISKNPSKSLNLQNSQDEFIELFYSILLYFNLNFQKEKIINMFHDEKIIKYLSKKLITFYKLFQSLILPKDIVRNLIKKSKTFDEILGFLFYIGTDIIDFLQLIYSEIEFIKNIFEDELDKLNEENENREQKDKREMKKIEIDSYVIPKKSDNIEKIYEIASLIYISEKMNHLNIIKFSKSLIGKYVEFYNEKNLKNLLLLSNLINLISRNDKKFYFEYNNMDIDLIIHDAGIILIKRKEIRNNEILEFISNDLYFNSERFEKPYYRPLEVLDGIDIENLDDKFFKIWNSMNFNNIFKKWMNDFYEKISSLIKDMKYFGLLYKFFLFNHSKKYDSEQIKIMKKKFMELLFTYRNEMCLHFVQDTIKLIYLLDDRKLEVKDLLELMQYNIDYEKVNEIYMKIFENYNNISDKTKGVMVNYLLFSKYNSNPFNLVYLIKYNKNLKNEILSKINRYILTENDFLSLEETDSFKFFKGLIDNKIIGKELEYKGATYLMKVHMTILSLKEKINNFDIKYSEICIFFQDEKNKNILKEKLLYLNFLNEIEQQRQYSQLEYKVNEVKNKMDEFELIYTNFRDFFYEKNKKDLDKLANILSDLKIKSLNFFENNLSKEYEYYSKFLQGAKKRNNLKRSIFFNEILKYNQKYVFKNNGEKVLEETEKDFYKLNVIFKKGGVYEVDENILNICILSFDESEKQLKNELNILSDIFKAKANLDDLCEDIFIYSKKGIIFDTAIAIDIFIEKIGPRTTDFKESIKEIIIKMKGNKKIDIIKKCYNKLKELNIFDGKERENNLIKILLKFKEKPDSIEFLLKTSLEEADILLEILSFNGDDSVNINDILNMEKCIMFFNNIGTIPELKKMKDSEIIEKFQRYVQEQKYIDSYFERYINNFEQIILLKSKVDWRESLKYKIKELFEGSTFFLSNEKRDVGNNKELIFVCNYESEVKNVKTKIRLGRKDIISLRDKALLSKIITNDKYYFINSITEIINISGLLKELYIRGYPKIIRVRIYYKVEIIKKEKGEKNEIIPKIELYIDDKNKNSFKDIIVELKNILEEFKDIQINSYKSMPLIRYLYGRQFNLLYDTLNGKKSNQLQYLLKYITNDSIKLILKET